MSLDLSLVRVFCAIYEVKSVSEAAASLALTQSAVSHSLNRLRHHLGDKLFIRSGLGMTPTPVADRLYGTFRESLDAIDRICATAVEFDPIQSTRTFRIAMSDIGEFVYLPPLTSSLRRRAPHVVLEVLSIPWDDAARVLATGHLDFAIGYLPELSAVTESHPIFTEHHVCLFRTDHPSIGDRLTDEIYASCIRVNVRSPYNRLSTLIAEASEAAKHQVRLHANHFTSIPLLIAETDLVVALPSRIARLFSGTYKLRSLPLPQRPPEFEVRLHWHKRSQTDRGHQWMRELMIDLLSKL